MRIGIDCGHTLSGEGTGASGCGQREENLTRNLGRRVIERLKKLSHTVVDCSVDKSSNQVTERVRKANAQQLDMLVSIHFNACVKDEVGDGKTTGVEVLVYNSNSKIMTEAKQVCNNISNLGLRNRGVKYRNDLGVLKNTNAPAMLIEVCFIDDKDDMNIYLNNVDKFADSIVAGILRKASVIINDESTTSKNGVYRVLVGSYSVKQNAINKQNELNAKGISTSLVYTTL